MESVIKPSGPAERRANFPTVEETGAFPFIEVSGSARTMGLQYGRKASARIQRSIQIYRQVFAAKEVDWNLARTEAARLANRITHAYPRIAEELRGVADGAEVPFEDIVTINARGELLHGTFGK